MLRKIKLYGKLAKFIGKRVLEADVATAAEAVRFLVANWPEVEAHMTDQHYRVSVGDYDLNLDEIHHPAGQQVIKIVPVMAGAGGGVGKILAGVALVAFAIAFAPAAAGFLGAGLAAGGSAFTLGAAASVAIGSIGASLILGGVAQLISPVPKVSTGTDTQNDPRKSYSFSGVQNTSRQGVPVSVVYGLTLVGSVVISAGIDTVQVTS
jgi:predicted phage tail protein